MAKLSDFQWGDVIWVLDEVGTPIGKPCEVRGFTSRGLMIRTPAGTAMEAKPDQVRKLTLAEREAHK